MIETAFARCVTQLTSVDAGLINLTASRPGEYLRHDFVLSAGPIDVRSLAKVVTVLTLGAAVHQGAAILGARPVDLDLTIGPLWREVPGLPAVRDGERWDRVRLRHLLSCTTGHDQGFLFRSDAAELIAERTADLPRVIADRELSHEPGTHFAYSNAGYFLLSVFITALSGRSLADWAADLLLGPLGVPAEQWSWRTYGRHPAAATGLRLRPEHLHRLAGLLLHGGRHDGRALVDAGWITAMTSPQATPVTPVSSPGDPLPRLAYGLGLWLSAPAGRCFGEGADGQYLVVDPASRTAITLTCARADPAVQRSLRAALSPLLAAERS